MPIALIIDDDPLSLSLMKTMLQRFGYDATISKRGDEGVELAGTHQPDLIIIDLLMPKATYDGVKVARQLRSIPEFKSTPIVAISAADSQTLQQMLDEDLFTDFIQKPVTVRHLEDLFTRLPKHHTT